MSVPIAALPMYDWPEVRNQTDRSWAILRDRLQAVGIEAPQSLARRNRDVGQSPADPDGFDLHALWTHPDLLFAQTCWGPLGQGLRDKVIVLGQPDYSAFEGGEGVFYASALLARPGTIEPSGDGLPNIDQIAGSRFAFNGHDSMSGLIALSEDLTALGASLDVFSELIETGSHRASIRAVAEGRADLCTIDCRTLDLARRYEPSTAELEVVGWTRRRPGLPFITALANKDRADDLRAVLRDAGMIAEPASR